MTSSAESCDFVASPPSFVAEPVDRERAALRVPTWAGLLLIAALWLIVRPYRGVRHDAVLYLGQTLSRLMPDTIGKDLFFAYGSQDRYSIFSSLMAPLVRWLGVGTSEFAVLAISEALFLVGCWSLVRSLPTRFLRWCSMLSLASISHVYGAFGMVAFAEPFLSARSLSEPFVVFALAFLMRGRLVAAVAFMLVAIVMHPLIALPGLVAAWFFLVQEDRRWLWALTLTALPVVAGAFGIAPFDAIWHRYDHEWLAAVRVADPQVFMANMTKLDLSPMVFDVGVLLVVGAQLRMLPMGRLIRAVILSTAVCFALWGIGSDLFQNVLLSQLQLWRAHWLTHLMALLMLPVLLTNLWDRGPVGRWAACAAVFAMLAVTGNIGAGWLCIAWAGLSLAALRSRTPVSSGVVKLATFGSVAGSLLITAIMFRSTMYIVTAASDRFGGVGMMQVMIGLTLGGATLGFVVLRGLASTGLPRAGALAAVLALSVTGAVTYDQRSDWQRYVENGLKETSLPFAGEIAPSARVYWDGSLLEAWMLMHRGEYYSTEQGAGLLFNRANATVYMARKGQFAGIDAGREICGTISAFTGGNNDDPDNCPPSIDAIKAVCATPGGPDALVYRAGSSGKSMGATDTWTYAPDDPVRRRTYRLYDCRKLH
jgi:hypothetical protein